MKPFTLMALLLGVLAAGSWAIALREVFPMEASQDGAAAGRRELRPYPGAHGLVMRRIVANGNVHSWPSPDGRRLAHQGYSGDLAVMDLWTGQSRLLTGDSAQWERLLGTTPLAFGARFAPDGQRIAYEWTRVDTVIVWTLRVMDVGTGEVRELLHNTQGEVRLGSWSPDGEAIVAVVTAGAWNTYPAARLALVRVRDGSVTYIASFQERPPQAVTFSPDGKWLAYHRARYTGSDEHDIFLRSVDGSVEHPLTRGPGDHLVAGWLPAGGPFFYLSGEPDRFDLLAVVLQNGRPASEPRLVRADLLRVLPRGFSANAFFFAQRPERIAAHTARIDLVAGRLTSPLAPIFLGTATHRSSSLTWSPDGARMAFMEGSDLVVRSVATGAERRIRTGFRANAALEWSPVAERLLVWGRDDAAGTAGTHILDLTDGSTELVVQTDARGMPTEPRWSHDGRALFVVRIRAAGMMGAAAVVRVDLDTGEEREVFRTEAELAGYAPHPDGGFVAVGESNPAPGVPDRVVLIPIAGGESSELARVDSPEEISSGPYGLEWTPDGRYLVISGNPDPAGTRRLWIVDRDGAERRELASFTSAGTGAVHQVRPRFHSGGRELSVIAGRNRWEIWTLENLVAEQLSGDRTR
jgi:Tol biopolymer transport system component